MSMYTVDLKDKLTSQATTIAAVLKDRGCDFETSLDLMTSAISKALREVYGMDEAIKLMQKLNKQK